MAKTPRRSVPQQRLVEEAANNIELRRSMAKALTTTRSGLYTGQRPTYLEGYVGQSFYFEGVDNLEKELDSFGFRRVFQQGQHRLFSPSYFGCPVYLTLHAGYAGDGNVRFNWQKGPVFKKSILENALSFPPLQPGLFDLPRRQREPMLRRLNLGLLHDVSPVALRAWMFFGTKWLDDYTLECPIIRPVCNLRFDETSIPDLAQVDDRSDYGVDFSEKTGT